MTDQNVNCDLCGSEEGVDDCTRYSAIEFRKFVHQGLTPDTQALDFAQTQGLSETEAINYWLTHVVSHETGWMLCPGCNARALRCRNFQDELGAARAEKKAKDDVFYDLLARCEDQTRRVRRRWAPAARPESAPRAAARNLCWIHQPVLPPSLPE